MRYSLRFKVWSASGKVLALWVFRIETFHTSEPRSPRAQSACELQTISAAVFAASLKTWAYDLGNLCWWQWFVICRWQLLCVLVTELMMKKQNQDLSALGWRRCVLAVPAVQQQHIHQKQQADITGMRWLYRQNCPACGHCHLKTYHRPIEITVFAQGPIIYNCRLVGSIRWYMRRSVCDSLHCLLDAAGSRVPQGLM